MSTKAIPLIPLFLSLSGCVGPLVPVANLDDIPPELKRTVLSIPIYNESQLSQQEYQVINVVEGISCKNKTWDPAPTKVDAINQAKYWAHELGADALLNIQCDHPKGMSTAYNCWESITCTAQAISLAPQDGVPELSE